MGVVGVTLLPSLRSYISATRNHRTFLFLLTFSPIFRTLNLPRCELLPSHTVIEEGLQHQRLQRVDRDREEIVEICKAFLGPALKAKLYRESSEHYLKMIIVDGAALKKPVSVKDYPRIPSGKGRIIQRVSKML